MNRRQQVRGKATRIAPLHVHSGYSLLRGTMSLEKLVERARSLGHKHLALTDVNNLCGATAFWKLARGAGMSPIVGAELRDRRDAVVALVDSDAGYENLCRIITRIQCDEGFRLRGALGDFAGGLHILTDDASAAACLLESFPRRRLWLSFDPPVQTHARLRELIECSKRLDVPLVASARALLAAPEDCETARLLAAVRTGATFEAVAPDELPRRAALLRSSGELARQLAEFPEAIANNSLLADRCGRYRLLPRRPVFAVYECPHGLSPREYLRGLCREGMMWRYGGPDAKADRRLRRELALIEEKGFSEYFLVVWDIVQYARRRGAPVAGRGSGAGSLAAYLLGITNVCPLAYDIPFERFLNARREDFPDLDVDFCWRIRDDVIDYAFRRWGRDNVAMVSAHNTFQPRSALRETAKAFGYSDRRISQLKPADLDASPCLRRAAELSGRIRGLPHNLSVHPGGIVISSGRKTIDCHAPLQPSAKGVRIIQYDKHGAEDVGLVKIDLLGNRSLSTIRAACDLAYSRTGRRIDIESLPPDDPATIGILRSADTVGCNQLESPAMRHLLRAIRPARARDVMKVLALIRPGAAGIGMKETFIRRHRGLETAPAGHPAIDAILEDTCGVMLYEDDVMLTAAALVGGDRADGDVFRRAVQKCRTDDERLELSREFLARCRAGGVDVEFAKSLWVQMAKFNAYSFSRAHAGSYAVPAFAVAYLKAHHPVEFWTAALNNNQSMYHPRVYVEQARRMGVHFLLPDVNRSGAEFTAEDDAIRIGLGCVAGLGPAGVRAVLDARESGAFGHLTECLFRTRLGREEARALILCGAFDFTGRKRPELMLELDMALAARPSENGAWLRSEVPMCIGMPVPVFVMDVPRIPRDYSPTRKYADQRRILGISADKHIMAVHRPRLSGMVNAVSRDLPRRIGRRIRIAGVLEARRTTRTRNGRQMMFMTLDDEFGLFEATVFPGACRAAGFGTYGPYIVEGRVEEQYDTVTVTTDRITAAFADRTKARTWTPPRTRASTSSARAAIRSATG